MNNEKIILNRRKFLSMVGVGLVAAAMPTLVHSIAPVPAVVPMAESKYVVALRMFDEVAHSRNDSLLLHTNVNNLLGYMFANFDAPERTKENFDASKLLLVDTDGRPCLPYSEMMKVPPVVVDSMWPLGIARLMFRDLALPLDCARLSQFDELHKRYSVFILADD